MFAKLQSHLSLKKCTKDGLQAVKWSDRGKFQIINTRKLKCSVDIDNCLHEAFASENRWDYLVLVDDSVQGHFVEIHPAHTSEVSTMIKKKQWLEKEIIKKTFKDIDKSKYRIIWIATDAGVKILKTSKQHRQLAKENLLPQKTCVI